MATHIDFINCIVDGESSGYKIWQHPTANDGPDTPTTLYVTVYPNAFLDIDEIQSQVLVRFWLGFVWHDTRLTYDLNSQPLQNFSTRMFYAHVRDSHLIPVDRIWTPFMRAMQATGAIDTTLQNEPTNRAGAWLTPRGNLYMNYGVLDWFSCEFRNTLFPFDIQQCDVVFHAPHVLPTNVDMIELQPEFHATFTKYNQTMRRRKTIGDWRMIGSVSTHTYDHTYVGMPYQMGMLHCRVVLVRNSLRLVYIWIAAPLTLVVTTVVTTFFVCEAGERASFVGSTVLTLFLLILALSDKLPSGSESQKVPFIIVFYAMLVGVLFATLMTSCVPHLLAKWATRREDAKTKSTLLLRLAKQTWFLSFVFVVLYMSVVVTSMYAIFMQLDRERTKTKDAVNNASYMAHPSEFSYF